MKQTKASEKKNNRELIQILEIFYRTLLDIYIYIFTTNEEALAQLSWPSYAQVPNTQTPGLTDLCHLDT